MNTGLAIFKAVKLFFNISRIFGGEKKIYSDEEISEAKEFLIKAEADLKSGNITQEYIEKNVEVYQHYIRIVENKPHPPSQQSLLDIEEMSGEKIDVLINMFEEDIADIHKIESAMGDGEFSTEKRHDLIRLIHMFLDESMELAIKKSPGKINELMTSVQEIKTQVIEKFSVGEEYQEPTDPQLYKYLDIVEAREYIRLIDTNFKAGILDNEDISMLSDIYEENMRLINNQPHPEKPLIVEEIPKIMHDALFTEFEIEISEMDEIEKCKEIQNKMFDYVEKIIEKEKKKYPNKINELDNKFLAYKKQITEELFFG